MISIPNQRLATAFVVVLAFGALPVAAADRYVGRHGRDRLPGGILNDCVDPAAPCKSLDRVLAAAQSGDVLNLAGGTYRSRVLIDWATNLTFLGGWDPTFTTNDPGLYPTVLRARGRKTPFGTDRRVFTIIAENGEAIAVTIDGLTLTGGNAKVFIDVFDTFAGGQDGGGGLAALAGTLGSVTLDVRRSTISGNRSRLASGGGVFIGASGNTSSIAAAFDRVRLTDNEADYAGAVELLSCGSSSCSALLTMTNCVLMDNEAEGSAAIHALGVGVTLDLTNTTITNNHGHTEPEDYPEGALVVGSGATANLTNTILWGNELLPPSPGTDLTLGPATVNLDHSDVGGVDVGPGTVNDLGGNLDVNPGLAGFALTPGSAVVDAGICAGAPPFDIDGDPRPSGAGCDVGADELVP
jgi:hypothetical protein